LEPVKVLNSLNLPAAKLNGAVFKQEIDMRIQTITFTTLACIALVACSKKKEPMVAAPPLPQGAVVGSMAADRDGDGVIDGYYSSDGIYHPNPLPPAPPAPMPMPTRKGERG
jgi:hypothetical protein